MSAEQKAFSRRATARRRGEPYVEIEMHDDGLTGERMPAGEGMPPVGKMGGDTFRASLPGAEASPRAQAPPRAEAPPPAKEPPRVHTPQAPSTRLHRRRWALKLALASVGIVAVIALLLVALFVSTGRISLLAPPERIEIDLRGGNLQGADLQGADLQGADLQGADLRGADLRGANAQRANLSRANLAQADLHYALLSDADLREADLRGANMQWTDLDHANLYHAQLEGANTRNARLEGATLPDGSRWGANVDMRRFTDPTYADFWRP